MYINKLLILKKLLQTNTHLGGLTGTNHSKWSRFHAQRTPSYILGFRDAQAIFDLDKTVISLRRACNVIQFMSRSNGHLLLVNTNPKYNKMIQQTAISTNQSFIHHKWIGGFLTNWNHMQNVQQQFQAATKFSKDVKHELSHNKQKNNKNQESITQNTLANKSHFDASLRASLRAYPKYKKMEKSFEGSIRKPNAQSPDCLIVFNANQNSTAIYEAHAHQIPIISVVDSSIPNELYKLITYPIPANYDSTQFIYLLCNCIVKTILVSRKNYKF